MIVITSEDAIAPSINIVKTIGQLGNFVVRIESGFSMVHMERFEDYIKTLPLDVEEVIFDDGAFTAHRVDEDGLWRVCCYGDSTETIRLYDHLVEYMVMDFLKGFNTHFEPLFTNMQRYHSLSQHKHVNKEEMEKVLHSMIPLAAAFRDWANGTLFLSNHGMNPHRFSELLYHRFYKARPLWSRLFDFVHMYGGNIDLLRQTFQAYLDLTKLLEAPGVYLRDNRIEEPFLWEFMASMYALRDTMAILKKRDVI